MSATPIRIPSTGADRACPWTDAAECAMAHERAVAGTSNEIAGCPVHAGGTWHGAGWCDWCETEGHGTEECTVPAVDADGYAGYETDGPFDAWLARQCPGTMHAQYVAAGVVCASCGR